MSSRLLIADDSTTIQKVFERTFPPEEFTLSFANTGEEALTKARMENPNVIIADINIPGKNGFEVCEEVKKDSSLKNIPVLLLVGILDDFDVDEALRVGADGHIVKPFEANDTINKVREALAKGERAVPTTPEPTPPSSAKSDTVVPRVREVFLCHAHRDKATYVRPLVEELKQRRVTFWLDEAEIGWGERITDKINQGLANSRYVLVFLSDAFLERNWPQKEMNAALNLESSADVVVVLPIMIASPDEVFARYPLLRDKIYLEWSAGAEYIADRLKELLT
jgi:CheY-like chemotaxis protein